MTSPDHAGPSQLRQLFQAVMLVGSDLDLTDTLQRFVDAAAELTGSRYAALGVLDSTHKVLREFVTTGIDDDVRSAIGAAPKGHGLLGTLISDSRPLRLGDLRDHPDSVGFPPNHPPMTTFLGVPVTVRGQVFGNLYLCDRADGAPFSEVDEELAIALAAAAAAAIDNARLHERCAELTLFEERERIARDLHDTVIQRLFGVGLSLQNTHRLTTDQELQSRIDLAVDDIDAAIHDLRTAIFELHTPRLSGTSARVEILTLCREAGRTLGFEPAIHFVGPVDTELDDGLADEVLAVLRESLANIAKHSHATHVDLSIVAMDGRLIIEVIDNGVGGATLRPGDGGGLHNVAARARKLGGTCEIADAEAGGTRVRWLVPCR